MVDVYWLMMPPLSADWLMVSGDTVAVADPLAVYVPNMASALGVV